MVIRTFAARRKSFARSHSGDIIDRRSATLAEAGVIQCWVDRDRVLHPGAGATELLGLRKPIPLRIFIRKIQKDHRKPFFKLLRIALGQGQSAGQLAIEGALEEMKQVRVACRRIDSLNSAATLGLTMVDLTAEHAELELLRRSEENLRYVIEYNPQLPWMADAQGNVIDFTDRWLQQTGLLREAAAGTGWRDATHPDDVDRVAQSIADVVRSGQPLDVRMRLAVNGEYRWMRAQAFPRRDETSTIVRWYGYTEDIHENVLIEEQIRWNAEHDPLTGLPNRALFNSTLNTALRENLNSLKRVSVILLDIDNFKDVNDLMGHHAGDQMLQHFASRLTDALGTQTMVARLGGDEFGILVADMEQKDEFLARATAALDIRESFTSSGRSVECRASMGVAIFPEDGQTGTELMRHADLALYHAKAQGKGQLQLFDKSLLKVVQQRVAMVNRARTAVREDTILAYYQPKISLVSGQLAGFEALLRWRDANGDIRAPGEIYAAFDDHDVADMIGQTMTNKVFADLNAWKREGLDFGHVAINVSSSELRRENFVSRLLKNMETYSIDTQDIEIEITEGVFLGAGSSATQESIDALFKNNISMALDDFGTGFASLSHLRSLPVSTLKIDRSFVMGISSRDSDRAIVAALISLGKALHMKVVAEGIEHVQQANILKNLGCDIAQGYLFARPIASEKIPDLICNWGNSTKRKKVMQVESR